MSSDVYGTTIIPAVGLAAAEIENILHDFVCDVTGLPPKMVRPRYQHEPPVLPAALTDWCAFGVTENNGVGAHISQRTEADGTTFRLAEYQTLTTLFTFYGPTAETKAKALRRSLRVAQNRTLLRDYNLAFLRADMIRQVPEPYSGAWVMRYDLTIYFTAGPVSGEGNLDIKTLLLGEKIEWHSN